MVANESGASKSCAQSRRLKPNMPQHKSKQPVSEASRRPGDLVACSFQQESILNSCRTDALAGATTQASVDVIVEGRRGCRQPAFFDGPHQVDTPTRTVIFVAGGDVSRAGLKAESAVNTSQ